MSRRDKRAGHPLKTGDKLSPLTEVLIAYNKNLRENRTKLQLPLKSGGCNEK